MPLPCPPPPIEPFQRLQVNDGLLLTAQLWQQAHHYHRQRQNIHYQSLNQPGIVWGLGVCLIPPPMEMAEQYRDQRWIEIQPGIAIDTFGNPIVVPQPIAFRLASPLPARGSVTIYLTVRYVDPDDLQGQRDRRFVQESFRIDETTVPPAVGEIELCRVRLQADQALQLVVSEDVLDPGINQLDLRYRQQAQARPLTTVRVGQLAIAGGQQTAVDHQAQTVANLSYLLQSLVALYPVMQAGVVESVTLRDAAISLDCDLLHLAYDQFLNLTEADKALLQQCLESGATTLIEISAQAVNIAELNDVKQQLRNTILAMGSSSEAIDTRRELEAELVEVEANVNQQIVNALAPVQAFLQQIGTQPALDAIGRHHLLRTQPFLFAQLPSVEGAPIYLFNSGGVVVVIGSLSQAWGIDDTLSLSRETIRTAQEMGINLLHFAWKRRQLIQLQRQERSRQD